MFEAHPFLSLSLIVSDRVIRLVNVRLEMATSDGDFHWLKKPSSQEVKERGGYVLAVGGPCAFGPSVVLNHHFGGDSELCPGEEIEGILLDEGTALAPDEYPRPEAHTYGAG